MSHLTHQGLSPLPPPVVKVPRNFAALAAPSNQRAGNENGGCKGRSIFYLVDERLTWHPNRPGRRQQWPGRARPPHTNRATRWFGGRRAIAPAAPAAPPQIPCLLHERVRFAPLALSHCG